MIATDPSGLQVTTTYYFKVNTVEYSILTGSPAPTFQEVADLMDAALTAASFSAVIIGTAPLQDIRVINEGDRGWDSEIDLEFGTSGPNLWTNLTGFVAFDPAVPGRGAFSIELESAIEAGGKVQTGGSAVYSFINEPPVGSIIISGAVDIDTIELIGTQGAPPTSIDLSGAGFYQIGYEWVAGGGFSDEGQGAAFGDIVYDDDVYMSSNPTGGITIIISGSADYEMEIIATVIPAAIIIGGSTSGFAEKVYDPTGGVIIEGAVSTTDGIDLEYTVSGGAVAAGASDTEYVLDYVYSVSGGAIFDGTATTEQTFEYNGLWFGDNYYKFNEKSGAAANDSFGSNDINFFGINWTEDAPFITGVEFKKSDVGILTSDISPQAVSFWHKRKTTDQDSFRVFGASSSGNWYFAYDPTYFRALIRNGLTDYYFFNGTDYLLIPDDDEYHWYYVEFYSGSNAVVYVDNVYRGTTVNFFGIGANELRYIGTDNNDTGFGPIDDLRIYSSYRLNADQRYMIYTQSPEPATIVIGGSAIIQPVILAGHEHLYTGKSGIQLSGQRYSYVTSGDASFAGTSPAELEFSYTGSGGIVLQSLSTFHDFGLGYIYDASGLAQSDGASLTEHTRIYEYIASGGVEARSAGFITIIIETSYILLLQEAGKVQMGGTAFVEGYEVIPSEPEGGITLEGAIDDPVVGIIAKTPTGKADLHGSADYSWAPESGYQELGL